MATINDPILANQIARVGVGLGTIYTPLHTFAGPLPVGAGGAFRLGMQTGDMAAALAANAELFQFRFVTAGARVCLVHQVALSLGLSAPGGNPAALAALVLRATVARAWTVAGSGGTRAVLTVNNQKLRTIHATSEVDDAGISTTVALVPGTKVLDAQDIGSVAFTVLKNNAEADHAGLVVPRTPLLDTPGLAFPLILAHQEGFVVRNGASAWPAGVTWKAAVDVVWSEVEGL